LRVVAGLIACVSLATMAVRSFGSHLADYGYLWWRLHDPDVLAAAR